MTRPVQGTIPDRPFFKIGEVAEILGVAPSAIRYWQREFWPHIRPVLTRTRQRVFTRRDLKVLAAIRSMLRDQGFTIRGAKERLASLLSEGGDLETADDAMKIPSSDKGNESAEPLSTHRMEFRRIGEMAAEMAKLKYALDNERRRTEELDARNRAAERAFKDQHARSFMRVREARMALTALVAEIVSPEKKG